MALLSDFAVKTRAELLRIGAEAEKARPGHNCPELAPCRLCAHYRWLHKQIDDHLTQLQGEETS